MSFQYNYAGLVNGTRFPPIPGQMQRFFDIDIWPPGMLAAPLPYESMPALQVEDSRRVVELKNQVKKMEGDVKRNRRLAIFTSQVVKKLFMIGQITETEFQTALDLGIPLGGYTNGIVHRWNMNVTTSLHKDILSQTALKGEENPSVQFPEREAENIDSNTTDFKASDSGMAIAKGPSSTTFLHQCIPVEIISFETCAVDRHGQPVPALRDTVSNVIAHGVEPEIRDIMFYYDREEDEDDLPLAYYLTRVHCLNEINERTNAKFKVSLKEALEIEGISLDVVQHINSVRNSNFNMLKSATSEISANSSKQAMVNASDETFIPPILSPICVQGDAGRHVSGIPIRIVPPKILTTPKPTTLAPGPSRNTQTSQSTKGKYVMTPRGRDRKRTTTTYQYNRCKIPMPVVKNANNSNECPRDSQRKD